MGEMNFRQAAERSSGQTNTRAHSTSEAAFLRRTVLHSTDDNIFFEMALFVHPVQVFTIQQVAFEGLNNGIYFPLGAVIIL